MPTTDFWLERWEQNEIGWHQEEANPQLEKYLLPRLDDDEELIFVPLCGKSRDMLWMAEQGCKVVGVEISDLAAKHFFEEHGISYTQTLEGAMEVYRSDRITIIVGDFFNLHADTFPKVTTVYDRGALVAIEPQQQGEYVAKMLELIPDLARILLLTVEYRGSMTGPPFSVMETDVNRWYSGLGPIEEIESTSFDEPRFQERGAVDLMQKVFWIAPRT